ncbi:MAG: iron-sulfur cluster assembly scaffold protein [Phenylobacterium sp.]
MIDDVYSTKVLALAANLPHLGRLEAPDGSAEKTSRLCGSRVTVDVGLDPDGRIDRFAQDVKACALGQASAAILGGGAIGATEADLDLATQAFRSMLKAGGPPPQGRFSDLAMLAPVKDYPARHASTLLAFEAALEAVRQAGARTSPAGAA